MIPTDAQTNPSAPSGDAQAGIQALMAAMGGAGGGLAGNPLLGAAQDVAQQNAWQQSRQPLTNHNYNLSLGLPSWLDMSEVQVNAAAAAAHHDQYDPYFGFLSDKGDDAVYMGKGKHFEAHIGAEYDPETHGKIGVVTSDHTNDKHMTVAQASNLPYLWSEDKIRTTIKQLQDEHLLGPEATVDDLVKVWGAAVQRASMTYSMSQGQNKMTPWDALKLYGDEAASQAKKYGSANYTGTHTQITRSVSDISQGDAWAVLHSNLSQLLGRDPSDQEVRDFAHRMNTLAAQNPSVTRTTAQFKDGQQVGATTSHTSAGFDSNDMQQAAYDQAQQEPDYGAYQAASVYFNSAVAALGAIGQVS